VPADASDRDPVTNPARSRRTRPRRAFLIATLASIGLPWLAWRSAPRAGPEPAEIRPRQGDYSFHLAIRGGQLHSIYSGVWGDEIPTQNVWYSARSEFGWSHEPLRFLGLRWGHFRTGFDANTEQLLHWYPSGANGKADQAATPAGLTEQVENAIRPIIGAMSRGRDTGAYTSPEDTCLPIRVPVGLVGGLTPAPIPRPEHSEVIPRWRLWLTGVLTASSFVSPPFALAYLLRWCAAIGRGRSRRRKNQCESCGYDLTHTPERCPECGAPRASG